MSDDLLRDTVSGLLAERCPSEEVDRAAAGDGMSAPVWAALEETGLTLLPVSEGNGGGGAGLTEVATVLSAAGYAAAPVPLVETALLAGWALDACGLAVPPGPLTAAGPVHFARTDGGWRLRGRLPRVPWASVADRVVLVGDGRLALVEGAALQVRSGRNVAGEPRDDLDVDLALAAGEVAEAPPGVDAAGLWLRGALGRALLIAGAARRALDSSVRYAGEREQFGRPIARFQAVQQHLAEMAGEVAAAGVAAQAAAAAAALDPVAVAVAKQQASAAAGVVARLAHQVHGAIGFTAEHVLRQATTRLWAWRDEFGNEGQWAATLGEQARSQGADGLWPWLTSVG